jgi:hypothetical protein
MGGARKPPRAQPATGRERTPGQRPQRGALAGKTKRELYEEAKRIELPGRSSMSRDELLAALREAG